MKKIIFLAGIVIHACLASAQQADDFLKKFFAVQVEDKVYLRWTMKAGSTCEDTYVERSSDGVSYERIGLIGGICGSPDEEITFEYNDNTPLVNRTAYYRLQLGYFGYTSPKIVEFTRYNEDGYFLGPNPFNDFIRLAFENNDKDEHQLLISDLQGRKILEMKTTGNEFRIRREGLNAGCYSIMLKKGGEIRFTDKVIAN